MIYSPTRICSAQGDAIELEAENPNNEDENDPSDRDEAQQEQQHTCHDSEASVSGDSPGDGKVPLRGSGGRFKTRSADKPNKTHKAGGGGGASASAKKRKGESVDRAVEKKAKGSGKAKVIRKRHAAAGTLLDWTSRSLPRTPYSVPLLLSCLSTHPDKVRNSLNY